MSVNNALLGSIWLLKNIEFDHADIYENLAALKTAFRRLINIVPRSGLIIAGTDSPVVKEIIPAAFSRVATCGIGTGEWQAAKIETRPDGMAFDVTWKESHAGHFTIPLPGAPLVSIDIALVRLSPPASMSFSPSARDAACTPQMKLFTNFIRAPLPVGPR